MDFFLIPRHFKVKWTAPIYSISWPVSFIKLCSKMNLELGNIQEKIKFKCFFLNTVYKNPYQIPVCDGFDKAGFPTENPGLVMD